MKQASKSNNSSNNIGDNFAKVVARAHTDVHISRLVFVHFDSSRLITCGKDNVRFWRLKNNTLRSCAVNLSPYITALNFQSFQPLCSNEIDQEKKQPNMSCKPSLEFTDICVNTCEDNNENLAYACTRTGQIFVFNMARMEIENVRMLEPIVQKSKGILVTNNVHPSLRLNSLAVSDSFCATGSDDGYVRIWTLDFSQVSVEAEHEAPIGLVSFSPDCFKIATATVNGNLGEEQQIKNY